MLGNPGGEDTVEGVAGGAVDIAALLDGLVVILSAIQGRDDIVDPAADIADLPVEVLLDIMASLRFGEAYGFCQQMN